MPGFSAAMIPALRIDYGEVSRRVQKMKEMLDRASRADLRFAVEGGTSCELTLDLRHRTAHASDGILAANGVAGNLPSGEAYIVPYEGERPGDPSGTRGQWPVQFGDEVVTFEVENNRAVRVRGEGSAAREQAEWLAREPAYGNIAELGLGVLGDFGLAPTGEILLDEKLGLHIAFGRSDHFGGQVGAGQFTRPDAVVHIDHVYIPSLQPRISASLDLIDPDGTVTAVVRESRFVLGF
jgi:leucyl aminopeptidase (aminopeptidase T)